MGRRPCYGWGCRSVGSSWERTSARVASHYGGALDIAVLLWRGKSLEMEWERRVVSLRDVIPVELLKLSVLDTNVRPMGSSVEGPWEVVRVSAQGDQSQHWGGVQDAMSLPLEESVSLVVGLVGLSASAQRSYAPTWPLRLLMDAQGPSASAPSFGGGVIDVDSETPPTPSAASSTIRRPRILAHRRGSIASVLGYHKAAGLVRIVGKQPE